MVADLVTEFRKARRDDGWVVLEGFHALKHALRFGADVDLAVSPDPEAAVGLAERLAPDLADPLARRLRPCAARTFARLAPTPPETGVIALARRPVVEAAALAERAERPLVLLDAPRHLGNVGAVVRVAAAADAAGVIVVGDADPWHPTAVRGGAGLQFALPCLRLDAACAGGRPLVGLDAAGEPLDAAKPSPASALVFGSERHGLTAAMRDAVERLVALPMREGVSSLNLASAVAATLYTLAPPVTPSRGA